MKYRSLVFALAILLILLNLFPTTALSAPSAAQSPEIGLVYQFNLQSARLIIQDNLLYSSYTHFAIADITDPFNIKTLDRMATRYIYDFVIDGQYVYSAQQDFGVQNLDILVNTISEFTRVPMQASATGVEMDGKTLYACGPKGIWILDGAKPADLTQLAYINTPANDLAAAGNLLLAATGYNGFRIYDVTSKTAPVELAVVDTPGFVSSLTVHQNLLYVADNFAGLRIYDLTDPKKPVELSAFDTPGTLLRVVTRDNYAYLADGDNGLIILDVSRPAAPARVASYDTAGGANDIALKDNLIYLADNPNGILILTWTPPVSADLAANGGVLESAADGIRYTVEGGAFAASTRLTHQSLYRTSIADGGDFLVKTGPFFRFTSASPAAKPVKINLPYQDGTFNPKTEANLGLYQWKNNQWVLVTTSTLDEQTNTITADLSENGVYGVFQTRK